MNKALITLVLTGMLSAPAALPINYFASEPTAIEYSLEENAIQVGKGQQYSTISSAIKNAKPGDVIVVREGVYNEQITMTKSGNANNYITIKAYPGENVVLDGKGLDTIVDFNGQDYINFEGFKIQNITGKQWAHGVYLGGGEKYINLRNLEVTGIINPQPTNSNYGANPILLFGEKSESIANVTIENCYVHDNVTGWCEAIAVSGNCENIQVLNNRVDNNGNIGIDFCGNFGYAPSNDQPRNCVARGNVISNCNSPYATSYGLYADGAYNIVFENNVIYNCQGGIEIGAEEKTNNKVGNIEVRNNLVYGCSENGITVGGYETGLGNVDGVVISHNTVVNNNCELTLSKCSNVTIQDNIFKSNGELVYSEMSSSYTKNITFNNNVYDGNGFTLTNKSYSASSWKSNVDKNAIIQDVNLDGNYKLQDAIMATDGTLIGYGNDQVVAPPENNKPNDDNKDEENNESKPPVEDNKEEQNKPNEENKEEENKPSDDNNSNDKNDNNDNDEVTPPSNNNQNNNRPNNNQNKPNYNKPSYDKPNQEQSKPNEESKSILPIFKKGVWFLDKSVSDIKFLDEDSIQFKVKKAWEGIWLDRTDILKGKEIIISADSISKNTEIQIYVNGKEVATLDSKKTNVKVKIPSNAKSVDFCIVSTKSNVTVKVEGLKVTTP